MEIPNQRRVCQGFLSESPHRMLARLRQRQSQERGQVLREERFTISPKNKFVKNLRGGLSTQFPEQNKYSPQVHGGTRVVHGNKWE